MLMGKVWLFIVVEISIATAVLSSSEDSGVGGQELDQKSSNHSDGTPGNEVTPKRPTLHGPRNRREFTGNWNISLKNKDQSNTPNKIRLNSNTRLHKKSQDISKKVLRPRSSWSLCKLLFEGTTFSNDIRNYALNTKFIKGMAEGSLKPTQFGRYMIQDIAYLANAGKMYSEAAQKMDDQGKRDFASFYRKQASKYKEYYEDFIKTWNLESADAVRVGPAFQTYMAYQQDVVKKHPKYLPVAMLPCTMLWPWLAGHPKVDEQNPYYKDWFHPNMREGDPSSTEKFVDRYKDKFEYKIARQIFCEGMLNELNAFREACNEALSNFSDICPSEG